MTRVDRRPGIAAALLAAALFGVSIPFSKLLLGRVDPLLAEVRNHRVRARARMSEPFGLETEQNWLILWPCFAWLVVRFDPDQWRPRKTMEMRSGFGVW